MERKKEDSYIHQMLEETYSFIPESESAKGSADLYKHFCSQDDHEKEIDKVPLLSFIEELSLHFLPLTWHNRTGCFRLNAFGKNLDMPSNWGPFSTFNVEEESFKHIDPGADDVGLLDVFSSLVGTPVEVVVLVGPDDKMYMSFLDSDRDQRRSELLDFIAKSFIKAPKKRSA